MNIFYNFYYSPEEIKPRSAVKMKHVKNIFQQHENLISVNNQPKNVKNGSSRKHVSKNCASKKPATSVPLHSEQVVLKPRKHKDEQTDIADIPDKEMNPQVLSNLVVVDLTDNDITQHKNVKNRSVIKHVGKNYASKKPATSVPLHSDQVVIKPRKHKDEQTEIADIPDKEMNPQVLSNLVVVDLTDNDITQHKNVKNRSVIKHVGKNYASKKPATSVPLHSDQVVLKPRKHKDGQTDIADIPDKEMCPRVLSNLVVVDLTDKNNMNNKEEDIIVDLTDAHTSISNPSEIQCVTDKTSHITGVMDLSVNSLLNASFENISAQTSHDIIALTSWKHQDPGNFTEGTMHDTFTNSQCLSKNEIQVNFLTGDDLLSEKYYEDMSTLVESETTPEVDIDYILNGIDVDEIVETLKNFNVIDIIDSDDECIYEPSTVLTMSTKVNTNRSEPACDLHTVIKWGEKVDVACSGGNINTAAENTSSVTSNSELKYNYKNAIFTEINEKVIPNTNQLLLITNTMINAENEICDIEKTCNKVNTCDFGNKSTQKNRDISKETNNKDVHSRAVHNNKPQIKSNRLKDSETVQHYKDFKKRKYIDENKLHDKKQNCVFQNTDMPLVPVLHTTPTDDISAAEKAKNKVNSNIDVSQLIAISETVPPENVAIIEKAQNKVANNNSDVSKCIAILDTAQTKDVSTTERVKNTVTDNNGYDSKMAMLETPQTEDVSTKGKAQNKIHNSELKYNYKNAIFTEINEKVIPNTNQLLLITNTMINAENEICDIEKTCNKVNTCDFGNKSTQKNRDISKETNNKDVHSRAVHNNKPQIKSNHLKDSSKIVLFKKKSETVQHYKDFKKRKYIDENKLHDKKQNCVFQNTDMPLVPVLHTTPTDDISAAEKAKNKVNNNIDVSQLIAISETVPPENVAIIEKAQNKVANNNSDVSKCIAILDTAQTKDVSTTERVKNTVTDNGYDSKMAMLETPQTEDVSTKGKAQNKIHNSELKYNYKNAIFTEINEKVIPNTNQLLLITNTMINAENEICDIENTCNKVNTCYFGNKSTQKNRDISKETNNKDVHSRAVHNNKPQIKSNHLKDSSKIVLFKKKSETVQHYKDFKKRKYIDENKLHDKKQNCVFQNTDMPLVPVLHTTPTDDISAAEKAKNKVNNNIDVSQLIAISETVPPENLAIIEKAQNKVANNNSDVSECIAILDTAQTKDVSTTERVKNKVTDNNGYDSKMAMLETPQTEDVSTKGKAQNKIHNSELKYNYKNAIFTEINEKVIPNTNQLLLITNSMINAENDICDIEKTCNKVNTCDFGNKSTQQNRDISKETNNKDVHSRAVHNNKPQIRSNHLKDSSKIVLFKKKSETVQHYKDFKKRKYIDENKLHDKKQNCVYQNTVMPLVPVLHTTPTDDISAAEKAKNKVNNNIDVSQLIAISETVPPENVAIIEKAQNKVANNNSDVSECIAILDTAQTKDVSTTERVKNNNNNNNGYDSKMAMLETPQTEDVSTKGKAQNKIHNSELKYNYKNAIFTEINEKVIPNTNQLLLITNSMINAENDICDIDKTCNKVNTCYFGNKSTQQNRDISKETNNKDVHSRAVHNNKPQIKSNHLKDSSKIVLFKKKIVNNHNSIKDISVNDKRRSESNIIAMKKNISIEQKSRTKKENKCEPSRDENKITKGQKKEFNNSEQGKNIMNKKNITVNLSQKQAPMTTEIRQIKDNFQCRFKTLNKVNNNFGAIINTKMSIKNYVIPKIKKNQTETNQDTTTQSVSTLKSINGHSMDVDLKSSSSQFITGSNISSVATSKPKQNKYAEKNEKLQNSYIKNNKSSHYQTQTKLNKQQYPSNVSFNSPIKPNNIIKHKITEENCLSKTKKMCHYNTTLERKSNICDAKFQLPREICKITKTGEAQRLKSSVIKVTNITPCGKQMGHFNNDFKALVEKNVENEIVNSNVQRRIIQSELSLAHNDRKRKPVVVLDTETVQHYKDFKKRKYIAENKLHDKKQNCVFQNTDMPLVPVLHTTPTDDISAAEKAKNKVNNNIDVSQLIAISETVPPENVAIIEKAQNKVANNNSDVDTAQIKDVSTTERVKNKVTDNNGYDSKMAMLETPQTEDVSTKGKAQNKIHNNKSNVSQLTVILETPQTEDVSTTVKAPNKVNNNDVSQVIAILQTPQNEDVSTKEKTQNKVTNNNNEVSQLIAILKTPQTEDVYTKEKTKNEVTKNNNDVSQLIAILETPQTKDMSTKVKAPNKDNNNYISQVIAILDTPQTKDMSTKEKTQNKVTNNNNEVSQLIAILKTPQTEDVYTKVKTPNKDNNNDVSQVIAILETPQNEDVSTKEKDQNKITNNNDASQLIAILETPQTEDAPTKEKAQNNVTNNNNDISHLISVPETPQTEDASTKEKAQNKVTNNNNDASQLIAILETPQTEDASTKEKAQNKVTNNNNDFSHLISVHETPEKEDVSTKEKAQNKATNNNNDVSYLISVHETPEKEDVSTKEKAQNKATNNNNDVSHLISVHETPEKEDVSTKEKAQNKVTNNNNDTSKHMPHRMSKEHNQIHKIETEILTKFSEFSNSTLFRRYITNGVLHTGFHSCIIKAEDNIKRKSIAVKYLLKTPISHRTQIDLLQKLKKADKDRKFHCICIEEIFELDSHWCIAMEYYPQNLSQALQFEGAGFHIDRVQDLSRQLLAALMLLRINEIIHRDIKPVHILINAEHTKIKLAGFDNAVYATNAKSSPEVGTLNYRAPEITLGMKISYPADLWAVACTMFEIATNQVLFEGTSTCRVLQNIMLLKGAFSEQLLGSSLLSRLYFQKNNLQEWRPLIHLKNNEMKNMKSIYQRLFDASKTSAPPSESRAEEELKKRATFSELVDSMLVLDGSVRTTVELAYVHPFIYK